MIESLLIANRGEIALRIIKACNELNIKTISIYSDADLHSDYLKHADEIYYVGKSQPSKSYLNIDKIIDIANKTSVEAIHPGYGFLSENSTFAEKCVKNNIIFVGPDSNVLELCGNKLKTRVLMEKSGIPVIPSYDKLITSENDLINIAEKLGYPVLLKSVYGGGGKGIRLVNNKKEISDVFHSAEKESKISFDKIGFYVEKFLENVRHIEFQIMSDKFNNFIHLGERECSIQRRFQKLIEFTPSIIMNKILRDKIGNIAVQAAKTLNYVNLGTIEFLFDMNKNFYFIEVNPRLQVEHPITEMVTGIDLIKQQLKIASSYEINLKQSDISLNGAAVECRINAEDPFNDFIPQAGKIVKYNLPVNPWVRIDSYLSENFEIPLFYDSLIAKVITWGNNFEDAVIRMRNALNQFLIYGIQTTIPFHKYVLSNKNFIKGNINTNFIESHKIIDKMKTNFKNNIPHLEKIAAILAGVYYENKPINKLKSNKISNWRKYANNYGVES